MDDQTSQIPVNDTKAPQEHKFTIQKKKVFVAAGIALLCFILLGVFFIFNKKTSVSENDGSVVATVGKEDIYKTYLNKELELYPADKTQKVKESLLNKVIRDSVILQGAETEGIIKDYIKGENLTTQEYLKRTAEAQRVERYIKSQSNGINLTLVTVWFFNNNYIGPKGLAEGKKIAYAKIKPLYDKVQKKEITITEAGQLIATDTSLKQIDPSYESNALSKVYAPKGDKITHWPEFDALVWKAKVGELTPLYLGDDVYQGKKIDAIYMFARVDKKIENSKYESFDAWYEKQKNTYDVTKESAGIPYIFMQTVFADDDDSGGGSTYDPSGGVHGPTSTPAPPPGDEWKAPEWDGYVRTQTGAPIADATVRILNNSNEGPTIKTDGNGFYYQPKNILLICNNNPHSIYAIVSNGTCEPIRVNLPNAPVYQHNNLVCQVTIVACDAPCTENKDCASNKDCSFCAPAASGSAKTCQPAPTPTLTPTPTPPACGAACQKDDECAGAKDTCTMCVNNTCRPPRACNTACTTPADCEGARDGCTTCVPNDTGTASSCKTPPACGTACTKDSQCAGARNGCTNCTGGKCTAFREDMCKCDGMDFTGTNGSNETFFPGDNVTFIAFGKVEGSDVNVANLQSMTFSLYQSKLTDPNTATRIAESAAITPQIVDSSSSKVRYKVTWNRQIPSTVPAGTLFRVQATIKCAPKPGVLGAKTVVVGEGNYFTQLYDSVTGLFARGSVLATTDQQLQLVPFFPGAKIQEKSCTFIKFYFE